MNRPHSYRTPARTIAAVHTLEGAGFSVHRPFPTPELDHLDPYLLLDEMGPADHAPGEAQGAPDHPHRGFETVTYMLEGEFDHKDSRGNHGTIKAGGVQWMTAGDGIVHSEMPSHRIRTEGGRVHGFQIWVNLPRTHKRTAPHYQSLEASDLTTLDGDGWTAKIIAGSLLGVEGPATTHTPIGAAHIIVEPGARIEIPVAEDHNAGVYSFSGSGLAGDPGQALVERSLAVFERGEGAVVVSVDRGANTALEALVLTGRPLDEPIARHGPFVMNTREELIEAFDDYNAGRMGSIDPAGAA